MKEECKHLRCTQTLVYWTGEGKNPNITKCIDCGKVLSEELEVEPDTNIESDRDFQHAEETMDFILSRGLYKKLHTPEVDTNIEDWNGADWSREDFTNYLVNKFGEQLRTNKGLLEVVDKVQSLLERERKKALEEVEKLFDDEDMCLYNDYGSKGLWDVCYKEWLSKLK